MPRDTPINTTFVFKQEGEKLSGTYSVHFAGEHQVTGTVKGDKVVFGFEVTGIGGKGSPQPPTPARSSPRPR